MTDSKVKSWLYTSAGYPETLKFGTQDIPADPAPHHILLQVKAAALNPVDIQLMNIPFNSLPGFNSAKIPARDVSGVVLASSDESGWKKGDEVMGISMNYVGTGFLAEVSHLDTRTACLIKKPKHMTWAQAASLPLVWLTARTSVERCLPFMTKSSPADNKLAVLGGSSGTGIYTVTIARQRGWNVLATCSGRNVDFVKGLGANQVVDYTTSGDAVTKGVADFHPDAIVDCVGGTECIGLAPQYITIVGDKTSRASMGGNVLYYTHPRMTLRWLLGYLGLGNSYECIVLDAKQQWLEECTKLKGDDQIIIDSVFALDKAMEAYERLDTGRARGKVVVQVEG
jgi:reticulon-4-interacting protein 1, mitochondrial